MTNYHALAEQIRQRRAEHGGKRLQLDFVDLTDAPLEEAWMQARQLHEQLGVGINWVRFCQYGELPSAPLGWEGDWFRDLPGVQRLYQRASDTALTMLVSRQPQTQTALLQTLWIRDPIVWHDRLEPELQACLPQKAWLWSRQTGEIRSVQVQDLGSAEVLSPWSPSAGLVPGASVMVVGGGIAGMTMAHTLTQRGFSVTVLDEANPFGKQGVHRGHLAAALTPVVAADDNIRSRLSRAGALLADRLWRQLPGDVGQNCGALQLEKAPDQRRRVDLEQVADALDLPAWTSWQTAAQASERAGIPLSRGGLWLPGGWLIQVERLLEALASCSGLSTVVARVHRLVREAGLWHAIDQAGHSLAVADAVVLASAGDVPGVLDRSGFGPANDVQLSLGWKRLRSMHRLAGEITAIPASALSGGPQCIVGGDGYVLPAVKGWCISGGTYVRDADAAVTSPQGRQTNLERAGLLLSLPDVTTGLVQHGLTCEDLPGWAGWRAVVAGRLPVVGPVAPFPDLFVCTAGASRGLTWSALQAQLLADHMEGRSPALEKALLAQISMI